MVNRFLRTAPRRTLLAVIAGFVAVVAGGTAIAIAAQGAGPVPKPKRLAAAVHDVAGARITGFSADIKFTNGLIGSSELQGADPLLQGGDGHVWFSTRDRLLRLELYGDNGDPEIVVDNTRWWVSDPTLQTVYAGTLPSDRGDPTARKPKNPTLSQIQSAINRLARHLTISRAVPTDVGGRPTYTVSVSPRRAAGLLGQLQLAWDAVRGVPLRFAVYARGDAKPVFQVVASNISYSRVDPSVFSLSPPAGYRVVNIATSAHSGSTGADRSEHHRLSGFRAVAKHVGFRLIGPAELAGMPRRSVTQIGRGALIAYGRGLDGIYVMEQAATTTGGRQLQLSHGSGEHQSGIALPTFSVHGVMAQELDTALGTAVRFTWNGITYTVLGSVKPMTARAAARGL
jgi:outer membrane lipoprotein-sorting protein